MKTILSQRTTSFIFALSIVLTGCKNDSDIKMDDDNPINIELTRGEEAAVKAVNDFAFELLKSTNKKYPDNPNFNISPLSAAWTLSMIANGATDGSETLHELLDVLNLSQDASLQDLNDFSKKLIDAVVKKNAGGRVNVANAIYLKKNTSIKSSYSHILNSFYVAEIFESPSNQILDKWINVKTDGRITGFAEKHNLENYDFGLLNTLFFEGYWQHELNKKDTQPRIFHNSDGSEVNTPMIKNSDEYCSISEDNITYLIKVKFKNGYFSISFLIPKDGKSIENIVNNIDSKKWRGLTETNLSGRYSLIMPKLAIGNDVDLIQVMKEIGITRIFDSAKSELNEISKDPIVIKCFNQATVFSLDESGAKAAVITNAAGMAGANLEKNKEIILNEPFLYFITEESTGAILFTGKVSQL